ncbi:MAG: DUF5822 domain-containing protein [Halobacteriaceae archaeon]
MSEVDGAHGDAGGPDAAEGAAGGGDPSEGDASGVDHRWVMETTFVLTILAGAPVVAALSAFVTLPTWEARVSFAVRVGAVLWLVVALGVYAYARRYGAGRGTAGRETASGES